MLEKTANSPIPWREHWVPVAMVAELTGMSENYITNKVAHREDFPKASRLGTGPRRWKVGEILDWMEQHREKKPGRPRQSRHP